MESSTFLLLLVAGCGGSSSVRDAASPDDAATMRDVTALPDTPGSTDGPIATDTSQTDTPRATDVAMPSPGCGMAGSPGGYRNGLTLTSHGVARTYALSVPARYSDTVAYPVVFVFHGDGGTGDGIRNGFPIEGSAGGNALFVYPDALAPDRSFDLETPLATNGDIQFFTDALAAVRAQYCVDDHRVFVAGFSRGAYFANVLGCRIGNAVIRAIAPHSGSLYATGASGYDADGHLVCEGTPPPAILFHGTADDVVALMDGEYARDQWVWGNGCSATTHAVDPSPCLEYSGCTGSSRVVWCAVPGLGHALWPSASTAAWTFFDSYR